MKSFTWCFIVLHLCCFGLSTIEGRREVKEYVIDLDQDPELRYVDLLPEFNSTVWGFWNKYFANDAILRDALYGITDLRGEENDEMRKEIQGLADASKLPLKFVHAVQMLYELQTLMVPIVNFTKSKAELPPYLGENGTFSETLPKFWEILKERIPWRGPGCTGIIAIDSTDGTVNHARNLDFTPVPFMTNLVYTGIFKKGGKEIFRSQMVAGYTQVITVYRPGKNGYAIERNTRYTDHVGGNKEMLEHLLSGRPLNGWTLRKIAEAFDDYDDAVEAIAKAPYVSTEYAIVSGVRKGTILSKAPDYVAHTQVLGSGHNFEQPDEYIIMTNFDFFWHDVREYFDPTGTKPGGFLHPRRIMAQRILNETLANGKPLTPDVLFDTINAPGVLADTIFQAVINVEKGVWNVSQPDL